jgi:hypothetical protein
MPRAKKVAAPETGTATVTIALKHPTGIIIEAFEKKTLQVPDGVGRLRDETVFRATGKQYPVNGNRVPFGQMPSYKIVGGYALTPGIPKDVWDAWLIQHHDHPLVENELISAFEAMDWAEDFSAEHQDSKSGLEPLARRGDPRAPKSRTRDGKVVETFEMNGSEAA